MPQTVPDLWPDNFGTTNELTPSVILKVQASNLASKTGGVVLGEVLSSTDGEHINITFYLVAPALNQYKYKLFLISHGFSYYPLTIFVSSRPGPIVVRNEAEFLERLREIFQSEETTRAIRFMIQHSRDQD